MGILTPVHIYRGSRHSEPCITLRLNPRDTPGSTVLHWTTGPLEISTWAVANGIYNYVYRVNIAGGETYYEVRVHEITRGTGYLVKCWYVDKNQGCPGGTAMLRESPSDYEEGRKWAEIALRYLAIDGLTAHFRGETNAWEGWTQVLAMLAGQVPADPELGGNRAGV